MNIIGTILTKYQYKKTDLYWTLIWHIFRNNVCSLNISLVLSEIDITVQIIIICTCGDLRLNQIFCLDHQQNVY